MRRELWLIEGHRVDLMEVSYETLSTVAKDAADRMVRRGWVIDTYRQRADGMLLEMVRLHKPLIRIGSFKLGSREERILITLR
jgi:hypothetical protein